MNMSERSFRILAAVWSWGAFKYKFPIPVRMKTLVFPKVYCLVPGYLRATDHPVYNSSSESGYGLVVAHSSWPG